MIRLPPCSIYTDVAINVSIEVKQKEKEKNSVQKIEIKTCILRGMNSKVESKKTNKNNNTTQQTYKYLDNSLICAIRDAKSAEQREQMRLGHPLSTKKFRQFSTHSKRIISAAFMKLCDKFN